jgi:hypothetical protein
MKAGTNSDLAEHDPLIVRRLQRLTSTLDRDSGGDLRP